MSEQTPEKEKTPGEIPPPQPIDMSDVVHQLEELVHLALECEKKELAPNVSYAEVTEKLNQLKEVISVLNKSYLDTLGVLAISEGDVQELRKTIQESAGPEKKMFESLQNMQTACESARDRMYQSLAGSREQVKDLEASTEDKKSQTRRKSKFKSMGGRKGWLPT